MYFTSKSADAINEANLTEFIERKIEENHYLDYKLDISNKPDKEIKKEFLKDITAFANAQGGNIIYGADEPDEGLEVIDQLQGIDDGVSWATRLESVARDNVDPRISGLKIIPVPLDNGKHAVLVHVPPSRVKPHMVSYGKHRTFYIRHWESSPPMTSYEIRHSVLHSHSYEGRAKQMLAEKEAEILKYYEGVVEFPTLIMQAVPLIEIEGEWDVHGRVFKELIRGDDRREISPNLGLYSETTPEIGIGSINGKESHTDPDWYIQICYDGQISAVVVNRHTVPYREGQIYIVNSNYMYLFQCFGEIIKKALEVTGSDVPYLISCKYINTDNFYLWISQRHGSFKLYEKDEIQWPLHFRDLGEDPVEVCEPLCKEMFNAFGQPYVID